ncbi:MAG: 4-hydroxythreonine-4-phosphate dehydrogenase PdxA [Terriglobia bacterium]
MTPDYKRKPRIGITLGDPAGVGPEVAVKACVDPRVEKLCIPILIGELSLVQHYALQLAPGKTIQTIAEPDQASAGNEAIPLIDLKNARFSEISLGKIDKACGKAALDYIREGVDLARQGKIAAMVTGPIHKEAAHQAGMKAPGHTEFLASLCGVDEVRMLLVVNHLRAMHLTTHLSLREALAFVKTARIVETIRYGAEALKRLHTDRRRMAVAGLNPHAGEQGMFGREEMEEITPAIQIARAEGFEVDGPIPPDTVFYRMQKHEFDLVIALYHDQGHIPLKLIGFDTGVNITIGLPIIRTSVDHGTAFDIAGKLEANPESMVKAIELACLMAS